MPVDLIFNFEKVVLGVYIRHGAFNYGMIGEGGVNFAEYFVPDLHVLNIIRHVFFSFPLYDFKGFQTIRCFRLEFSGAIIYQRANGDVLVFLVIIKRFDYILQALKYHVLSDGIILTHFLQMRCPLFLHEILFSLLFLCLPSALLPLSLFPLVDPEPDPLL